MGRQPQKRALSQPACLSARGDRFTLKFPGYRALANAVRDGIGQEHRYAHSIRVARCAELLAMRHGLDTRGARIAGLLHDIARLYSPQRMIEECTARGIVITELERESPVLLHAALGAQLARERFGVTDPDVLSAIRKHTSADSAMSPLDCVVYLADSLEPQRTFPERDRLWRLAQEDLDAAMAATLQATVTYLRARGLRVVTQMMDALHYFNEGERRAG